MRTPWIPIAALAALLSPGTLPAAEPAEPPVTAADLPRVPATEPKDVLSTFQVRPGFRLQLVASEPLVASPVAMDFDENGRLFVVEMIDYSERRDEHLGRIRLLEDTDGDGVFDRSSVFADGIPWPTAVLCYKGGVFVGTTPDILYLPDANRDGVADSKRTVFTGFAVESLQRLNVQALLNSFRWGVDNRVHGSASVSGGRITSPPHPERPAVDVRGRDFSFDPESLELRAESGGGQHGMSFDNAGRKFVCSNSDHLQAILCDDRYLGLNPDVELPPVRQSIAVDGPAAEVFRISPDEPWRVIRTRWRVTGAVPGMIEGGGRPSGYFTGATGATIYRGNAFPPEYLGDAFVADCGSNLIHHKKLRPDGVGFRAERPADELDREFVASRDNWFRPVQFANAPDGALWVIDMYRETIEHPWSLPESIKKHLDLNSGNDRGRIYRILPERFQPPRFRSLSALGVRELVGQLEHPNGWHRDTACRLLVERRDRGASAELVRLVRRSRFDLSRMHALWVLQATGALEDGLLAEALSDPSATVREHAIRIAEARRKDGLVPPAAWKAMRPLARDPDLRVRHQLAWTLGLLRHPDKVQLLRDLLVPEPPQALIPAVLNASAAEAVPLLTLLLEAPRDGGSGNAAVPALARMLAARHREEDLAALASALLRLEPGPFALGLLADVASGMERWGGSLEQPRFKPAVASLSPLAHRLATQAGSPGVSGAAVESALVVLAHLSFAGNGDDVMDALESGRPDWAQRAALRALGSVQAPGLAAGVLARWDRLAVPIRADLLSLLLRRRAGVDPVLDAVEHGRVARAEISAAQLQRLRGIGEAPVQARVARLFGEVRGGSRQEVVNRFLPALSLKGDPAAGRQVYEQRCATCHRVGGQGRAIGPDFESVRSMGREKLLTNILDPNREVAPSYLAYNLESTTGESVTGLLVQETADQVRLRAADGTEPVFTRRQIRTLAPAGLSLMPEGLEQGLEPKAMADLLEFILRGAPAR